MMIRAGLYTAGSDPALDIAIESFAKLDAFLAEDERENTAASFRRLAECLKTEAAKE
jgi:flagellum-specific ATP synthase